MEVQVPAPLPAPSPAVTAGMARSLARWKGWFNKPGRFAGWALLPAIVLFVLSTAILGNTVHSACVVGINADATFWFGRFVYDYECLEGMTAAMGAISITLVHVAAASTSSIVANVVRAKPDAAAAPIALRLQGIKDWFIRGEIEEAEYERMRGLLKSWDDPASPHRVAAAASGFLRSFAGILVPLAIFWFVFIAIFVDEMVYGADIEYLIAISWIGGAILFLTGFIVALVRGAQLRGFQRAYLKDLTARFDAAEEEVMRKARGRAGHRTSGPSDGASTFTPYARRRA